MFGPAGSMQAGAVVAVAPPAVDFMIMGAETMLIGTRFGVMTQIVLSAVCLLAAAQWVSAEDLSKEGKRVQSARPKTIAVTLGSKTIRSVVADTEAARKQGLLGWDRIDEDTGMLLDFVFEGNYAIHMQGMKFPIDALWIDKDGLIRLIYQGIQPNSGLIYPSMYPSRYCLEIKSGSCDKYGIRMGQRVDFGAAD